VLALSGEINTWLAGDVGVPIQAIKVVGPYWLS
jgi:hypothetical protein